MAMTRKQAVEKIKQYLSEVVGLSSKDYKIDDYRSDMTGIITITNPKDQHIAEFEIPKENDDNNNPGELAFINVTDERYDNKIYITQFAYETWEEFVESTTEKIDWLLSKYAGLMTGAYLMLGNADLGQKKVDYCNSQLTVTNHDGGTIAFAITAKFGNEYNLKAVVNDSEMNYGCYASNLNHKIVELSKDFLDGNI